MFLIQSLTAGHTPNGNPKRVYVVYNQDGSVEGAFDEGYEGVHAVPEKFLSSYTALPTIHVTTQEYRFWVSRSKARA